MPPATVVGIVPFVAASTAYGFVSLSCLVSPWYERQELFAGTGCWDWEQGGEPGLIWLIKILTRMKFL